MNNTIQTEIISLLSELSESDVEISIKSNLFEEKILDSFKIIEFIGKLEEKYGILFSNDDLNVQNFGMIESIVQIIQDKQVN